MSGGYKKIEPADSAATQFSSENQPAHNPGRPPKGFRAFAIYCKGLGHERVTDKQIEEGFTLLLDLPVNEILKIAGDPKGEHKVGDATNEHPAVLRLVAKEFFTKRGQAMLKQVLDRAFGTAMQKSDVTTGGDKLNQNPLSALPLEKQAEILMLLNKGEPARDADE